MASPDFSAIEEANELFRIKNGGKPWYEWEKVFKSFKFGPIQLLQAGTNPALHFLGHFDIEIIPRTTPDGCETVRVINKVSWESYYRFLYYFGYFPPPNFMRLFGKCPDMDTIFTWPEHAL